MISFRLNDRYELIKRAKMSIYISKKSIYIKKVYHYRFLSIYFGEILIDFGTTIKNPATNLYQKSWFDHDLSQNLSLRRLHCINLLSILGAVHKWRHESVGGEITLFYTMYEVLSKTGNFVWQRGGQKISKFAWRH